MQKTILPFFIVGSITWIIVHLARYYHHPLPLLNGQLTDLLAVPVMADGCLWIIRRWVVKSNAYYFPLAYLLFMALYLALVFECILPHYSPRFTADWRDAVAYLAGCLLYYTCQLQDRRKRSFG